MKRKSIIWGISGVLGLVCFYLLYQLVFSPKINLQPIYLIPANAVIILESNTPVASWATVSKSSAWNHLKKNDYFNELSQGVQRIDHLFQNQKTIFNLLDDRDLYLSIHPIKEKQDYGIFYVLDLQKLAKINLLRTYLNTLLSDGYTLSKRTYHGHEILEVFDEASKETLHLSFINNQLIASFTHILVEQSIDQYTEPKIGRDFQFIAVNKAVHSDKKFRLYLQYEQLENYFSLFAPPNETVSDISELFMFSGFSLELLEDEILYADGVTNLRRGNESFLRALQQSGTSTTNLPSIAPAYSSALVRFGFSDFSTFYQNFEAVFKQSNSEQYLAYQKQKEEIEKWLDINLEEDFISWMGDELGLIYLPTDSKKAKVAVAIASQDLKEAKEKMTHVLGQIKKKTPVKFKSVVYKEYPIHFLDIKGFFNLFFEKKFASIDKPYFTYLNDYVVFSNSPNTLREIIDQKEAGALLETHLPYQEFSESFEQDNAAMLYLNTPLALDNLKSHLLPQTQKSLEKNRVSLINFSKIGLSLFPEEKSFNSELRIKYEEINQVEEETAELLSYAGKVFQSEKKAGQINDLDPFLLPTIYPSDFTAKSFVQNYSNGKIKFEVELRDGKKHGRYRSYYPSGEKKITGRFREDEQIGTWRYFNVEGKLLSKKKF